MSSNILKQMDKSFSTLRIRLNCGIAWITKNKEITQPGQSKIIEEIIPGSDKEKERGERRREREEERKAKLAKS